MRSSRGGKRRSSFAVGHPLLQPILWISDVLHGGPGQMIGGLVPASFLAANILFIGATAWSKELRGALNVAALSAFLTYVGAGLDGQAGLGDFNLQLNDDYQGEIVRGCPAYDEVRRPSMNGFDLEKYQGTYHPSHFRRSSNPIFLSRIFVLPHSREMVRAKVSRLDSIQGSVRHHPGYKVNVG